MITRRQFFSASVGVGFGLFWATSSAHAESLAELNAAADAALERLVASEPVSQGFLDNAAGLLIFPNVLKGGFLVGGARGQGVLRVKGETVGTYATTSVSFGLQAGVSKFGYIMVLNTTEALDYVQRTDGWEVGVGPNVTVADQGFATRLSTTTKEDEIVVFFVDQKGLFAGAGLEGTKISPIAK